MLSGIHKKYMYPIVSFIGEPNDFQNGEDCLELSKIS
jgi:hypothetical protein